MNQLEFKYHADSNVGKKRTINEDAFSQIETKYGNVFMVCDGMGGHAAGERASEIAISVISEYLESSNSDDFSKEIDQAIQFANKSIWEEASQDLSLKGMGTTCVVLYLTNKGEIFIGHVGDSRCYSYTHKEGLSVLTKDHSQVQFLIEIGEVKEEEAFDHPKKNIILKALGISESVTPEVTEHPVIPDKETIYLLCSDGLNDMLRNKEIQALLEFNASSEKMVNDLIEGALEKGGKDNVTVGVLKIESNPFYSPSPLKDKTLIVKPGHRSSKHISTKKLILLFSLLALAVLLFYLFRPKNSNENNDITPNSNDTISNVKTDPDKELDINNLP